jgi:TRAP-type C4-dicarboxylate transport system permease large subunit
LPPNLLLFVMASLTRTPLAAIIREIWPFVLTLTVLLLVLTVFPAITLFLPRLFGYG